MGDHSFWRLITQKRVLHKRNRNQSHRYLRAQMAEENAKKKKYIKFISDTCQQNNVIMSECI